MAVPAETPRPFIIRIGRKLRDTMDWITGSQSLIPVSPVLDPALFGWTGKFAEHRDRIASEVAAILAHRDAIPPLRELSPDHADLGRDGKWRSFFLLGYGYEVKHNCDRVPVLADLVRQIPDLNLAFLSILDPGAQIPRHRGVSRGLVTMHYGLSVPNPPEACWMEVDHERLCWRNGEWLAFDDTYEHEVHNETDQIRVILLVQIKRPMRRIGTMVHNGWLWGIKHTPFVQEARANMAKWETAFKASEAKVTT
jgi:beta-hydroxylase